MKIIRDIGMFLFVISPLVFAAIGIGYGVSWFVSADTLTELLKGIITAGVSGVAGVILFFGFGSMTYA